MVKEIKGTDKISEAPAVLNDNFKELEKQVEKLSENTRGIKGIKTATWITAISTLLMAIVGAIALIIQLAK